MSTLYVDNLRSNLSTKITVPSGNTLYATGHVIQTTQAEITTNINVNTTTWTDLGAHSITPSSTSSKIKFTGCITGQGSGTNSYTWMGLRLLRGSTVIFSSHADANGAYGFGTNTGNGASVTASHSTNCFITYLDSPATTSSVTYNIQAATYDTSVTWDFMHNGGVTAGKSIFILEEIAG